MRGMGDFTGVLWGSDPTVRSKAALTRLLSWSLTSTKCWGLAHTPCVYTSNEVNEVYARVVRFKPGLCVRYASSLKQGMRIIF